MVTMSHFCIGQFTDILKHTHHPNMEQHVCHFYDHLQGSTMDLFIFSVLCLGRVCTQLVTLSAIFHVFHSHPKMKSHQIIGNHP